MSGLRNKFWLSLSQQGILPHTGGGFTQQDFKWFDLALGQTLIRTRVDVSLTTSIYNDVADQVFDPQWFALVSLWFGVFWVDGDGSEVPPRLNDDGVNVDWVIWQTLSPRVDVPSTSASKWNSVVTWHCNGDVTLDSKGRRGPAQQSLPQLFASWGWIDPLTVMNHFADDWTSATYVNVGMRALFEDSVGS